MSCPVKIIIFHLLTLLVFGMDSDGAYSQDTNRHQMGQVRINQDVRVDLLISKHIQINHNRNGIDGYRIQIFFDSGNNSKTKAQSIYEGFKAKYPDVRVYLSFKSPNYKVRVGDFRTKLDAQRFLNEIVTEYPNAWIIADQINLPEVN